MSENEQTCPMCRGCGEVADDDDNTPWVELARRANLLICKRPIECPSCSGAGVVEIVRGA